MKKKICSVKKKQLLIKGYPFDEKFKKYGYYIIKIDNDYYQYKSITEKNIKIDIGDKLLSQNVNISSYQFVPITIENLQEMDIVNQKQTDSKRFK